MSNRRNYYRILYVQPDAPIEVIKANYRALMQKLRVHPDVGGDDWNASLLNAAYAALRDVKRRAAYDRKLLAEYDIAVLSGGHRSAPGQSRRVSGNRRNYYRILQIQPGAPAPLVEASYRAVKNTPNAPADVAEQAYETLRDPIRRGAYDAALEAGMGAADGTRIARRTSRPATATSARARRPRFGAIGYEPLITGYCAFCKTPHQHGSSLAEHTRCVECGSPLTPPTLDRFKRAGRTLERMRGDDPIAYYVYWPGTRLCGHIHDLSPSGMRFATEYPLSPGQVIKIDTPRFQAIGEVAHARTNTGDTAVGLKFLTVQFAKQRGTFLSTTV